MLTIQINNTGAAFDNPEHEAARILRRLADQIENQTAPEVLRDLNGNICGTVEFDPMTQWTGEA